MDEAAGHGSVGDEGNQFTEAGNESPAAGREVSTDWEWAQMG